MSEEPSPDPEKPKKRRRRRKRSRRQREKEYDFSDIPRWQRIFMVGFFPFVLIFAIFIPWLIVFYRENPHLFQWWPW